MNKETPKTIYIAGPMRGIPYFNFAEFDAAAAYWQNKGWRVMSPADLDREIGFDPYGLPADYDWQDLTLIGFDLNAAIQRDVDALSKCDAIFMLEGWENSKGARAEKAIAEWRGMQVIEQAKAADDPPPTKESPKRIALVGFSRAGKDEVGKVLINHGYERRAPGDIIKRQMRQQVSIHFGIDTFTEDDEEKAKIRPLLEAWGEVNYTGIQNEFFEDLPERCVNTKLVRWPEAEQWKAVGGSIYEVFRPGQAAATEWEEQQFEEVEARGLLDGVIRNGGTLEELRETVETTFNLKP